MKLLLIVVALLIGPVNAFAQLAGGQAVSPNAIDATAFTGADMCAKISNAATALYNSQSAGNNSGGTIDARGFTGTQNCAGSMFASWPNTYGNFMATVLLGRVTVVTAVPQIVPSRTSLVGVQPGFTAAHFSIPQDTGTVIEAANSFPSSSTFSTTLITIPGGGGTACQVNWTAHGFSAGQIIMFANDGGTLPAALSYDTPYWVKGPTTNAFNIATLDTGANINCATASSGTIVVRTASPVVQMGNDALGSDSFNVKVEHIMVECASPNLSNPLGATGLLVQNAQEGSAVRDFVSYGCHQAMWINTGAGDGNIYEQLQLSDQTHSLGTPSDYNCLRIGQATTGGRYLTSEIKGIGCYINNSTTPVVTVPVASPCVVNWTSNIMQPGYTFQFINGGGATLPTGASFNTTYYVTSTSLATNSFTFATTLGGSTVNCTGAGSTGTINGARILPRVMRLSGMAYSMRDIYAELNASPYIVSTLFDFAVEQPLNGNTIVSVENVVQGGNIGVGTGVNIGANMDGPFRLSNMSMSSANTNTLVDNHGGSCTVTAAQDSNILMFFMNFSRRWSLWAAGVTCANI